MGLPSAICAESVSCRACSFSAQCGIAASEMLESMTTTPIIKRERLRLVVTIGALAGVPLRPTRTRAPAHPEEAPCAGKIPLTKERLEEIGGMSKKVGQQVLRLSQNGWFSFARAELKAGRNPAEKGWKYILCASLLLGGTTRRDFELAMVEKIGITPAAAKTQASLGFSIMAAGRVANEVSGVLKIAPN